MTQSEWIVIVVGAMLCLGFQLREWRRQHKRQKRRLHDPDRIDDDIRNGVPIWWIELKRDAEENL